MSSTVDNNDRSLEFELSLILSQVEGHLKFLDYMNNELVDAPRNLTEQRVCTKLVNRIEHSRTILKELINTNRCSIGAI
jgi:hypothetical protein